MSKRSIQVWTWSFISIPNLTCMCKVLPIKRFHSKVTILVQNFRKVANFHKFCVPHDNYLELVTINLSNEILCIGILHQFLSMQSYFIITFLLAMSFALQTSKYVKEEQ